MTTRPGNAALGLWTTHRTKRATNLVRIVRTDGEEFTFSDHDRALVFEGKTYQPGSFVGMSAERREVALRTPDQELHGIIDGDSMVIPDLLGQRYLDAEVWHVITDWQWPWLPIARNYKTIRSVRWDDTKWVASLDGVTQVLERTSGGRFGGKMGRECPYNYGDANTCRKDISAELQSAAVVDTITDERLTFTFTAGSWTGTWSDDYYRDGEVEWLTGDNEGVVSPIVRYVESTREVELFAPTPFDIQASDTANVRAGCNGLFSTCQDKSNSDNFGGHHLQPQPGDMLEIPR